MLQILKKILERRHVTFPPGARAQPDPRRLARGRQRLRLGLARVHGAATAASKRTTS